MDIKTILEHAAANTAEHPAHPCAFFEITSDTPEEITAQLLGKDRVHAFGANSMEELYTFRLGGPNHTKTVFGLIDESAVLQSAIYVEKNYNPIEAPEDLRGDVGDVLVAEVKETYQAPKSMIFYSISNMTKVGGMGPLLIRNMHPHLVETYPGAVLSTLSPMRELTHPEHGLSPALIEEFSSAHEFRKREIVYDYMCQKPGMPRVQDFHMGNGAVPVTIRFDADTKDLGLRVMANYWYNGDAAQLKVNAQAYRYGDRETLLGGVAPPSRVREEEVSPAFSGWNLHLA